MTKDGQSQSGQKATMGKDRAVVRRTLARYRSATLPSAGLFVADVVAAISLVALVSFANPLIMGMVVDKVATGTVAAENVMTVFGPYIAAFVVVNLIGQLCSKFVDYATWKLQIQVNYRLATVCFSTLANQSMTFHSHRMGGSLVSQTTKFMNAYAMLLENLIYTVIPIVCSAVLTVCILAPRVAVFVIILAVLLALYVLFALRMYTRILPLNTKAAGAYNRLLGQLADSVTNIVAVKTYGREIAEQTRFDEANQDVLATDSLRMRASTLRGLAVAGIILAMSILLAVFVTGGNAWFGIAPGTLVMMFTYTYTLTTQFDRIGLMLQQLNRAFGDAHEMTRILDEPLLVEDKADAQALVVHAGSITFENIGFAYDSVGTVAEEPAGNDTIAEDTAADESAGDDTIAEDTAADDTATSDTAEDLAEHAEASTESAVDNISPKTKKLFQGFDLHIPAGQRVGLVGRSGAGKTTLVTLLLRLSDIQEGCILIDGQDISACTQQSLRNQIAYVPQEALLFHRSIRENIAYGRPDATDEEICEAARLANALEFIEALPEGLDTQVGERGAMLSGGQRQRIAIARALLADCPILVLDEATSALDSENERLVQGALVNLMQGRTCIVIAHRLSTVANLDRIVVLEDGAIVEDGTHASLLATEGLYASLWNYQTGYFDERKIARE